MQKFLTPDLKYKLRQSIPFVIVTVITCIWSALFHIYVISDLKVAHEEIKEMSVRNRETHDKIDQMTHRVDHLYYVLIMQNMNQKTYQK